MEISPPEMVCLAMRRGNKKWPLMQSSQLWNAPVQMHILGDPQTVQLEKATSLWLAGH